MTGGDGDESCVFLVMGADLQFCFYDRQADGHVEFEEVVAPKSEDITVISELVRFASHWLGKSDSE